MELIARAWSKEGQWLALGITAPLVLTFLPIVGLLGSVLHYIGWGAAISSVAVHIGRHRPGLPTTLSEAGEGTSFWEFGLRGTVCALPVIAPFAAWMFWGPGFPEHPGASMFQILLLLALGIACVPAAVVSLAVTNSTISALNPLAWLEIVGRMPLDYARTAVTVVGIVSASAVIRTSMLVAWPELWIFGELARAMVAALMHIAAAAVIGGMILRNADAFGMPLERPIGPRAKNPR